jgi:hypothetical protein
MGNEVVSEVTKTGKKQKTFVFGAGTKIAMQKMYGTNYDLEFLTFSHADASGASMRETQASGMLVYPEQAEESPAELDALGGNVGLSTPNVPEPEPIPPPENSPFQIMHEDSPMYVDGQRVTATLDGLPIGIGRLSSLMANGSVAVGYMVHISGRGFHSIQAPIDSYGGGLFGRETPPTRVRPDGDGGVRHNGGYNLFSFGAAFSEETQDDKWEERRITTVEARILKRTIIETISKNDLCKKYITDLINKVAEMAGKSNKIISTDIGVLFDKVLKSRSRYGDSGAGGIFLKGHGNSHASQSWDMEGGGWGMIYLAFAFSGGYSHVRIMGARGKETVITTRLNTYDNIVDNITGDEGAMIAIHELMHTAVSGAGTDYDYSYAVAELAGDERPVLGDNKKGEVSNYWNERLRQACGLPSITSGLMTNYKLYK